MLIYGQARQEANALFDYQMKQVAAALPSQFADPVVPPFIVEGGAGADLLHADEDVVIHIWDAPAAAFTCRMRIRRCRHAPNWASRTSPPAKVNGGSTACNSGPRWCRSRSP